MDGWFLVWDDLTFVEVAERGQRDQREADLLGPQTSPGRRTARGWLWHFSLLWWVAGWTWVACHGQSPSALMIPNNPE